MRSTMLAILVAMLACAGVAQASGSAIGNETATADQAQDKATFPALIGLDASRARLDELRRAMDDALSPLGERANALAALGRMAIERDR